MMKMGRVLVHKTHKKLIFTEVWCDCVMLKVFVCFFKLKIDWNLYVDNKIQKSDKSFKLSAQTPADGKGIVSYHELLLKELTH